MSGFEMDCKVERGTTEFQKNRQGSRRGLMGYQSWVGERDIMLPGRIAGLEKTSRERHKGSKRNSMFPREVEKGTLQK